MYSILFPVSQGIDDEEGLEAELTALLKTGPNEAPSATTGGVVSPIKQTTTDEDDLEARLAALRISAGQREKGTADSSDQVELERRDKPRASTKKLQPLPA